MTRNFSLQQQSGQPTDPQPHQEGNPGPTKFEDYAYPYSGPDP